MGRGKQEKRKAPANNRNIIDFFRPKKLKTSEPTALISDNQTLTVDDKLGCDAAADKDAGSLSDESLVLSELDLVLERSMFDDSDVYDASAPCPDTSLTQSAPAKARSDQDQVVVTDDDTQTAGTSADLDNTQNSGSHSTNQQVVWTYPTIWDENLWHKHKTSKPWLDCRNGFLGCKECRAVKDSPALVREVESMSVDPGKTIRIARHWADYDITYNGDTRTKQLTSLRKKMFDHGNSKAHVVAVSINSKAKHDLIGTSLSKVTSRALTTTSRCFRTVYKMCKSARPFTDYPMSIELQELNGLDMGRVLHSNVVAKDIASFISQEMKSKMVANIVNSGRYFSIMLDESTSLSMKSTMIVYIRHTFGSDSKPTTMLLDLVEIGDKSAKGIRDTLYEVLIRYGITAEVMATRWFSLTTDGCSTMLGRVGGLHALIKQKYPHVISWHCSAHRLELSVNDALKSINATNHFKSFLDEIHKVYSMSTKNQSEIEKIASSLGEQLCKIGKVFTIRWVASTYNAVSAVWKSFDSLAGHFHSASTDPSRTSTEQGKFRSLYNHLLSVDFVRAMAVMLDVLHELSRLSLALQSNSITIPVAQNKLALACRVLASFKQKPGPYESKLDEKFRKHELKQNVRGISKLPKSQFLQAIIDSLNQRMFTSCSSETAFYNKLISALTVLSPSSWSEDNLSDVTFGDSSIRHLATVFRLSDPDASVDGFREFVDGGGRDPRLIEEMTSAVSIIAVSSAECERGFRAMNGIMTKLRSCLLLTLSDLLFLYCACPPLDLYNPDEHVKLWFRNGRHSATDTDAMSKRKPDWTGEEKKGVWDVMCCAKK